MACALRLARLVLADLKGIYKHIEIADGIVVQFIRKDEIVIGKAEKL